MIRALAAALACLLWCGCPGRPIIFDCSVEDCESCAVLESKLGASAAESCRTCQGADAGTPRCTAPVRAGKHVLRGCNVDSDCPPLSPMCAQYSGMPHNTCVVSEGI